MIAWSVDSEFHVGEEQPMKRANATVYHAYSDINEVLPQRPSFDDGIIIVKYCKQFVSCFRVAFIEKKCLSYKRLVPVYRKEILYTKKDFCFQMLMNIYFQLARKYFSAFSMTMTSCARTKLPYLENCLLNHVNLRFCKFLFEYISLKSSVTKFPRIVPA